MNQITHPLADIVISGYTSGMSVYALCKKYNIAQSTVNKILDENYIPRVSQARRLNPSLKENYFEIVDSAEKAYWIGWLLTDGSIGDNGNSLEMTLVSGDADVLDLLQQDLCIEGHVKPFQGEYTRFALGSKKICEDLSKYGVVKNKTLNLKFPKNIPVEFEAHLLRGMFEGDGGLTAGMATRFYKHRGKYYTKPYRELSFTGTYDMCQGFHDKLQEHIGFTTKNIGRNHSIYRVRWSNLDEVLSILEFLYKDCGDHKLNRKYELFQRMKDGSAYDAKVS